MPLFSSDPQHLSGFYIGNSKAIDFPEIKRQFRLIEFDVPAGSVSWQSMHGQILSSLGANRITVFLKHLVGGITDALPAPSEPKVLLVSTDALRQGRRGHVADLVNEASPILRWRKSDGIVTILLTADDEREEWADESLVYEKGIDLVVSQDSMLARSTHLVRQSILSHYQVRTRDGKRAWSDVGSVLVLCLILFIVVPAVQDLINIWLHNWLEQDKLEIVQPQIGR